jgi:cytochrome c-type biogenesis protein CcmF
MPLDYVDFGRAMERVSLGLAALTILLALVGVVAKDRRWVLGARNAMIAGGITVTFAAACLVAAFFDGVYGIEYVFSYSESKLDPQYKFAGLWAGLDGSILFWAMLLGMIGAMVAWSFRKRGLDPSGRRLEPWVYVVYAVVQLFFLAVICFESDPFRPVPEHLIRRFQEMQGALEGPLVRGGIPTDGRGLNPLLENYWMTFHPPSVYLGFILYTVPFAFGMAALIAGEFSSYWIRTTRKWTLVAWLFNTNGIILGGLWAYEVLGWGGYWAWDPVENASFLPWLTGTAFVHSVMIQERRDMLRVWNATLIALTFIMSIFGTYLTRSGIVSSVHAFASGDVGTWFFWFLMFLIGVSMFFLFFRMRDLRSANSVDSVLSREGVFLLNNMVLVAITGAIVVLTLWPKISMEFINRPISVNVPVYNLVCTPFFALLLLLTAIGPSTAWVRTSMSRLVRNLAGPAVFAIPLAALTQWLAHVVIRGEAANLEDPISPMTHLYPGFVILFLGYFILTALAWEVLRTVNAHHRVRKQSGRKGGWVGSFLRVGLQNNRRYGGYLVHVGMGVLAIGVACSSIYAVTDEVSVAEGQTAQVEPYEMQVSALPPEPVSAYISTRVQVSLKKNGTEVASLDPERRFYPRTGFRLEDQPTTEVKIKRFALEDFYVYFEPSQREGTYIFTIFRKPLISLVWLGWILMIAGGLFAAVPIGRRKVGLAA